MSHVTMSYKSHTDSCYFVHTSMPTRNRVLLYSLLHKKYESQIKHLCTYILLLMSRLLLIWVQKPFSQREGETNTSIMIFPTKTSNIDRNLSDQKLQGTTPAYNLNDTRALQTRYSILFKHVDRHGNWPQSTSSYGLLYLVLRYHDVYDI